jgi:uncharacterized protein
MPYLIDGHNLIPHIPELHLEDIDDEIKLIVRLQVFAQQSGKPVEVFFDNAPPGSAGKRRYGMVSAVFVRQGRSADDAIRKRLEQLKGKAAEYVVVSSDRQVQAAARAARARAMTSPEFALQMGMLQKEAGSQKAAGSPEPLTA